MALETGIHPGLSMAEYIQIDAANCSTLKLFDKSAAHADEARRHPKEQTDAMLMGSAVHCAILEPDLFPTTYCRGIKVDRRTKQGKLDWAQFENENIDKLILKPEEFTLCNAMRDAAWRNPRAAQLLGGAGANELSVIWNHALDETEPGDPVDGEWTRCKSRIDRLTDDDGWTTVLDVKTTRDASQWGFGREIAKYAYHVQAAFYLDGLDVLDPRPRKWAFLAIEKEPPFGNAVYFMPDSAIEVGRLQYERWLREYCRCVKSGLWPGYPVESEVDLPEWVYRRAEEGF